VRVHILGSGSRGNAVVLDSGRERLLVDAGFGPRVLARRLRAADVAPESITTLVLTHEHSDHVFGATRAARRWQWKVYGTRGTLAGCHARGGGAQQVELRRELVLDDFTVRFVRTPHDAREPVALVATARSSGTRVGIAYDLGHATHRFAGHFADVDILLLEANHDEDMLRTGSYPWPVKQRIAGPNGHLSNTDAGRMARGCAHRGLRHLVLCHLSENNNLPQVALGAVRSALRGTRFRGTLHAASQDRALTLDIGASRRASQLVLDL
jgi:phosphoribosyl 1,2-cyclic phosphodiesterase